jgi:protein-L-isoaspartate(D-aspartate) O-methyltransferase
LKSRFGEADPAVVRAFGEVPREYFHYNYEARQNGAANAYETEAKPWAIGFGSALSDYLGQAYMTQACQPKPDHVVLEIGTGSGFQAALLSRIVAKQYSIEIIEPLGRGVQRIFAPIGFNNLETRVGDGFFGWPEVTGGFDTIIVTCAAQYVPPALLQQLKPGGRLVIPIGQPFRRGQFLYIYTKDEEGRVRSRKDVGVYFIPMTGTMMKTPAPAGSTPQ